MDYLLLYFFRLVRSTDRLDGGRSVLRHTIDRMRLWCVFLNTGGVVSRMTSPYLLVGLPLHPYESKGKGYAYVEGLDSFDRAFEGVLMVLGVGGCCGLFLGVALGVVKQEYR